MNTEIPGYYYSGDVGSVADYGGRWIGTTKENCGEIIEVIGMSDLEDGDAKGAIIQAGSIYVTVSRMRQALQGAGWPPIQTPAGRSEVNRVQRRAMMLEAIVSYWGFDVRSDFGGPYELRVLDNNAAIEQANRWAR
jgi:hypothetical protein